MADYHFVSTWRMQAPIEQVWAEIFHAERWPDWWKYVVRVDDLERGALDGVGKRQHLVFRTRLPYTLGFDIRITQVQPPSTLKSEATGELEGTGRWMLAPYNGGTLVRYNWDVRTTRWWMNLLAPIARPAFNWNHDQLMHEGGQSLARRLGVELELPDAPQQPATPGRWVIPAVAVAVVVIMVGRRRRAPPREPIATQAVLGMRAGSSDPMQPVRRPSLQLVVRRSKILTLEQPGGGDPELLSRPRE